MSVSSTSESISSDSPRSLRAGHLLLILIVLSAGAVAAFLLLRVSPAAREWDRGQRLAAIKMDLEAKQAYDRAIALDPRYAPPYRALAEMAESHGALTDSVRYWKQFIERDPTAEHARCKLAIIEQRAGQEVAALKDAEEELKRTSECPHAHLVAGTLYARKQNAVQALKHLEPAAKTFADQPQVQLELGRILALTADYDRAEQVLLTTLKLDSAHAQPYYWLGYIYARRPASPENAKKADEYLRQALNLQPDYPEANVQLAQQLLRYGKAAEALPLAKRAVALRKHYPLALFALAEAYAAVGKEIESAAVRASFQKESDLAAKEKACLKTYTAQPDNLDNVLELAEIEMKRERFQEALLFLQDADARNPNNPRVLKALELARQRAANAPPAETFFE